jgi:glucose/arabinose dehydrogenase
MRLVRVLWPVLLFLVGASGSAWAQAGDPAQGKIFFGQNCALCHSDGTGDAAVTREGPTLAGVLGRRAGADPNFTYTDAMRHCGLTWDAPTLDRFLTNPTALVPGTTMPIAVAVAEDRQNVIAYLSTLKTGNSTAASANLVPASSTATDPGDWRNAAPRVKHHIKVGDLPAPYATRSAGNGPKVVPPPDGATLSVPAGFTVKLFASGFSNPRIIRIAPNGDIFVAETAANRIRIMRAADGADAPTENQIFAQGLDRPFGIAFYPPGNDPQWIYVANNNSVVRIPYHSGDLQATGDPQIIVSELTESHGGHSTRDVAFSLDGKRMFISVGSASNVAEEMSTKSVADAQAWEATHGRGAAWDAETNRADILVTDPEGHAPLKTFATGIRNGVGIAVDPKTGKLWSSTNERDGALLVSEDGGGTIWRIAPVTK